MSAISSLPAGIVSWLSEQEALSDIRFMTEFPPTKKAIPLNRAIVAVGLEEVKLEDSFEDDGTGVLVANEYCRLATLKIKLAIHIPFSQGGATCHDVFTNIIDCLSFASDLHIIESGCTEVTADRDTDALVLNAWLLVTSDFCPAVSSALNFHSFLNKELLCGSHISDSVIHVTQGDKDLWNSPIETGTYTGLGGSVRTIPLDFTPRAVIVFAQETAQMISTDEGFLCCMAFAVEDFGSLGISIVENGFRLFNGVVYMLDDSIPGVNEPGFSYSYIAFR